MCVCMSLYYSRCYTRCIKDSRISTKRLFPLEKQKFLRMWLTFFCIYKNTDFKWSTVQVDFHAKTMQLVPIQYKSNSLPSTRNDTLTGKFVCFFFPPPCQMQCASTACHMDSCFFLLFPYGIKVF